MFRPIILIDEAQAVPTEVLSEIRLISSMDFDSKIIVAVVLCGDGRLSERLQTAELLPLGSRIRTRHRTETLKRDDLRTILEHAINAAGAPQLMTSGVMEALAEHSCGNVRAMMTTANELLIEAATQDADKIDENLFFSVFNLPNPRGKGKNAPTRTRV